MVEIVELIVAMTIGIVGLVAALMPIYRGLRRTEEDARLARIHSTAANDAVNRTHEHQPRLADNVLMLLEQSHKHDAAIDAMQDELVLIRACCVATKDAIGGCK